MFCEAGGQDRRFLTGCEQNRVLSATRSREYVATEPPVQVYRSTTTTNRLKRYRHTKWRIFSVHWVLSKLHPRTAPRKKTPLAPRRTTQAPPAAYPPTLAPPPAPRVEHASWASPMPLGGAVRPSYRALYGQLRAVRGASEGVLSDDFVALAPTYASAREHLRPRYRGPTSRASLSREGHGRRGPLRHDRYAANQGSGGGDGGGWR